jgi:hypothetical protein
MENVCIKLVGQENTVSRTSKLNSVVEWVTCMLHIQETLAWRMDILMVSCSFAQSLQANARTVSEIKAMTAFFHNLSS